MAKNKKYPTGNRKLTVKRRISRRRGPFAQWLTDKELTLTHAARILGVSVQHVSNLVHGHAKPSLDLAMLIQHATCGDVRFNAAIGG